MKRCSGLLVALGFAASCFAAPITVEVDAWADAFVRSLDPDHNYGAAGGLSVSGSAAVNVSGEQMGLLDSLIRFDLSAAVQTLSAAFGSVDWEVTDAVLAVVEQGEPNNPIFNRGVGRFEVRWIADDTWVEGTGNPRTPTTDGVTYDDVPSLLDAVVDTTLGIFNNTGSDGPVAFALEMASSFVSDVLSGGPVSFFLTAIDDSIGFTFDSTNNTPPSLAITAAAVPYVVNAQIAEGDPGSATVSWATTDSESNPLATTGAVRYKAVNANEWTIIEEAGPSAEHSLQITGLQPDTNYGIVIVNNGRAEKAIYYPAPWPIPGDVIMDCKVNILDMIAVRNKLNSDPASGDNWQADVNEDSHINVLDMLFVRDRLNSACD